MEKKQLISEIWEELCYNHYKVLRQKIDIFYRKIVRYLVKRRIKFWIKRYSGEYTPKIGKTVCEMIKERTFKQIGRK